MFREYSPYPVNIFSSRASVGLQTVIFVSTHSKSLFPMGSPKFAGVGVRREVVSGIDIE